MKRQRLALLLLTLILAVGLTLSGCEFFAPVPEGNPITSVPENVVIASEKIPAYTTEPYYVVNGNTPLFTDEEITDDAFYEYTDLDSLGRAGMAWGCVGPETLPEDEREDINHIYPSGWKYNGKSNNNKYDKSTGVNQYIYNRAHLLANQLVSDDVDERNFFTGTCDMNQKHMVKFENMVADYVKEDGGHVMYRVTPYFEGHNLICAGVLMEGYSVEDEGDAVLFCVFIYNVQPNIYINYLTGENCLADEKSDDSATCTHTNTELRGAITATCNTAGYTGDTVCLSCGATTKVGEATAKSQTHGTTEIRDSIAPTCIAKGYSGDEYCTVCGTKTAGGEELDATEEHIFGSWSAISEVLESRKCTGCELVETRSINPSYAVVNTPAVNTAYKLMGEHGEVKFFGGTAESNQGLSTTARIREGQSPIPNPQSPIPNPQSPLL